tara:strand:+ start:800 stop:901 length:102 start_codon:yes stop_codon:yes gene_type:complete
MERKRLKNNILIGLVLGLSAVLIDMHLIPGGIY